MILGALVDYYEILAKAGQISRPGYCKANVSYALDLAEDGRLIGVMPLKREVQRGKKTVEVPRLIEVPEQAKRSVGVCSNFLCDNSGYVLGIDNKGKPERTRQCFEAFKKLHHDVLDGVDSVPAKAILRFLDAWEPDTAKECAALQDEYEALTAGANIIFQVAGLGCAQDDEAIRQAWERHTASREETAVMQCLVTGQTAPVARLHPSIKGVKGGQPTGVSIVSFNDRAYESYGHEKQQGLNAPVSESATFAYTTALNYLLADTEHKQTYGDTTVIYWAESSKPIYRDLASFFLSPEPLIEDQNSEERKVDKGKEKLLGGIFESLVEGEAVAEGVDKQFDKRTRFYVLGLAPNAARLSIRFFLSGEFGGFLDNLAAHHRALDIERSPKDHPYLPLWRLLLETVSPKSKDKASSPLLSGAVLRSILSGDPYPDALFSNVLLRIRADHDVSRSKAAIIKAYLLRYKKEYKEEATVSLNEQSGNPAYVLGRLFAVLEKAQQDANPGINATIKDRYFTSACATPASVFPVLLRLAGHHTSKAKFGYVSERKIRDLLDKLDVENNPYPAHLGLPDQGVFILGYYHQLKANYTKKDKEDLKNDDSEQI